MFTLYNNVAKFIKGYMFFIVKNTNKAKREAGESPARSRHCKFLVLSGFIHWKLFREGCDSMLKEQVRRPAYNCLSADGRSV